MADASMMSEDAPTADAQVEFRPCPYCGHAIHPSSHRCPECTGHVGIAWGTVHKELYLFLLCSILILVGCLASWSGRVPVKDAAGHYTGAAAVIGIRMTGLDTIRGTVMFAIALYGVIAGLMNIFYRRMVVWPYLLNSMIALWVGVGGITAANGGDAWKAWGEQYKALGGSVMENFFGGWRSVPPGFILLTLAGFVIMARLLGGIVAAATANKGAPADEGKTGRRRKDAKEAKDAAKTDDPAASATGGADAPKP